MSNVVKGYKNLIRIPENFSDVELLSVVTRMSHAAKILNFRPTKLDDRPDDSDGCSGEEKKKTTSAILSKIWRAFEDHIEEPMASNLELPSPAKPTPFAEASSSQEPEIKLVVHYSLLQYSIL